VEEVIGEDLVAMAYEPRLQALLAHRIGLWDVMKQARGEGSLDSNIRDHAHNDLVALVEAHADLKAIAFNGGTAARIGSKALGEASTRYELLRLPSSSPAHASIPYAQKLLAWQALRRYLESAK
jgi:hypoxanthine-DNA glycosylase